IKALERKLDSLSTTGIKGIVGSINLKTMTIVSGNERRTAYCYEEFVSHPTVKKYLEFPKVEQLGEWVGFWTEPETQKHYGTLGVIAPKSGISRSSVDKVDKSTLQTKNIIDRGGRIGIAYAYEDFIALEPVKEILAKSIAEKGGDWTGFWFDEITGQHFGPERTLSRKLGVSSPTIKDVITRLK